MIGVLVYLAWPTRSGPPSGWIRALLGLLALAVLYFAGEEASWGQHLLGFQPPEDVAATNYQQEFNFHNNTDFHELFNETPRTAASLFCVILCGLLPLWMNRRGREATPHPPADSWRWLIPGRDAALSGVSVFLIDLPERAMDRLGVVLDDGPWHLTLVKAPDEFKELLMAITLLAFVASLVQRARIHPRTEAENRPAA